MSHIDLKTKTIVSLDSIDNRLVTLNDTLVKHAKDIELIVAPNTPLLLNAYKITVNITSASETFMPCKFVSNIP